MNGLVERDRAALLVIDVQERINAVMADAGPRAEDRSPRRGVPRPRGAGGRERAVPARPRRDRRRPRGSARQDTGRQARLFVHPRRGTRGGRSSPAAAARFWSPASRPTSAFSRQHSIFSPPATRSTSRTTRSTLVVQPTRLGPSIAWPPPAQPSPPPSPPSSSSSNAAIPPTSKQWQS